MRSLSLDVDIVLVSMCMILHKDDFCPECQEGSDPVALDDPWGMCIVVDTEAMTWDDALQFCEAIPRSSLWYPEDEHQSFLIFQYIQEMQEDEGKTYISSIMTPLEQVWLYWSTRHLVRVVKIEPAQGFGKNNKKQ